MKIRLRFREWGSTDWTYITLEGELACEAMSVAGLLCRNYHVQEWRGNGTWENLQ